MHRRLREGRRRSKERYLIQIPPMPAEQAQRAVEAFDAALRKGARVIAIPKDFAVYRRDHVRRPP